MGQHKRKAPKLGKKPPAKRRAVEARKDLVGIVSSKQSLKQIDLEDEQFSRYLSDKPLARSAFSPELIEDELASNSEGSDPDEINEFYENDNSIDQDITEHAQDLENLKNTDPAFYQFLLENDRELLGFGKESKESKDKEENVQRDLLKGSRLTLERFNVIKRSSVEGQTVRGLALFLAAYRGAIRSVANMEDILGNDFKTAIPKDQKKKFKEQKLIDEGYEKNSETEQSKKLVAKPVKLLFHLEVEGETEEALKVFNEVVIEVTQQIGKLFAVHARMDEKEQASNDDLSDQINMMTVAFPKPQELTKRLQILINQFWVETTILLKYLYGKPVTETIRQLQQNVLINLSSPLLLRWLVCLPDHSRSQLTTSVIALWLGARKCPPNSNMSSPIAAFLVLQRLAILMSLPKFHSIRLKLQHKEDSKSKLTRAHMNEILQNAQQTLMSECYRAFIHLVLKTGFSWRVAAGFQFIINCLVELLSSVHSAVAYRVTFLAVRQLGLVTRNASVARSRQRSELKGVSSIPAAKVRLQSAQKQLFNWSFIFSARFLVQAIGKIGRQLKQLAFPLSSILTAVVKPELNTSNHVPFILHCLQLQCDLMGLLECWIPMGSHLLALGTSIVAHQEKVCRELPSIVNNDPRTKNQEKRLRNPTHVGRRDARQHQSMKHPTGPTVAKSNIQKAPDIDVYIRLSDAQLEMPQIAEQLTSRWLDLVIDHMGLLAHHPSFPETSIPLIFHLKKLSKSRDGFVRKQMKQLLNQCEITIIEVKQNRLNLDPMKDIQEGKLLVFNEKDISLARYRSARVAYRLELFSLKMNAETKALNAIDDEVENVKNGDVDIDGVCVTKSDAETIETDDDDNVIKDKIEAFVLDTDSENEEDC